MRAALAVAFALSLLASTGKALEPSEDNPLSDTFDLPDATDEERAAAQESGCNANQWSLAQSNCDIRHAPSGTGCNLSACVVRNGWIVYSWTSYHKMGTLDP